MITACDLSGKTYLGGFFVRRNSRTTRHRPKVLPLVTLMRVRKERDKLREKASPKSRFDTTVLVDGIAASKMTRSQLVDVVAELIEGQNRAVKRRDEDAERRRRLAEEALQERMRQLHEHLTKEHKTHMNHLVQRYEMQFETLRLEAENRIEQARLTAEQEKLDEIQKIRERYRQDLEKLVNGEQNRLERTLEDAKENCEHILKVNVAYIEKLQAEQNSTRSRCDHLDEQNQLLKRQLKFATQKVQQLLTENRQLSQKLEKIRGNRSKFDQLREETYKLAGENRLLKSEVLLAEEYFKKAAEERDELYSTFVQTLNQIHSRSSYKSAQVRQQLDLALGSESEGGESEETLSGIEKLSLEDSQQ
ncbi:calcium-binding and coiled-coil domain-containing protein 2 [Galendromus occidentalis]|uniref:Calcium-binding and coiled-coil domain-containing protein 2 n=1 Tax=Galendromus occidentalis TaxID=34638 RepID=A0AAJ6QNN5_9ACAR|nr:calcium-binding and coiled-coil domain-containing protein 2 [Galendromus occidentalis]